MSYNGRTVNVKMTRIELCDLLIATTSIAQGLKAEGHTAKKWGALHDKLREQLNAFNEKNGMGALD